MSQQALAQVLRQIPQFHDPNVLIGSATADDAGVYRINSKLALVQTVDFFTPIVDDPFVYGQIAAANGLSDIYAMGGRPLTAMALMGIPTDLVPPPVINAILRGGAGKVKQAKCALIGGHTIRNPEPLYGLSVTGLVSPQRILSNAGARANDLLVLTKPLGLGIITTGIKRGLASPALEKKAISVMIQLNTAGTELGESGLVRAAVDVTGFGLIGHLLSMCRASRVGAEIEADRLPAVAPEVFDLISRECIPGGSRDNLAYAAEFVEWETPSEAHRHLATDAQTSGGLLLCVPPRHLDSVLKILKRHRTASAAVIGRIVSSRQVKIKVSAGTE